MRPSPGVVKPGLLSDGGLCQCAPPAGGARAHLLALVNHKLNSLVTGTVEPEPDSEAAGNLNRDLLGAPDSGADSEPSGGPVEVGWPRGNGKGPTMTVLVLACPGGG